MTTPRDWAQATRLGGLRRFATAITLFNILGHTVFGFEQSWLQPFVALATAYVMELLLEFVDARANGRTPRFRGGGFIGLVDFLLSAHISALAITMLLYANDRLWPIAFTVTVAISSKFIFRIAVAGRSRHFLNPSNFGITLTLLLFPWVGIAPPYHFTENLSGWANWILPGLIVVSGTLLNARYTRRLPLLGTWVGVFVLQAVVRSLVFGTALGPALLPATGVAFLLFTFYMVTDPATTPRGTWAQVVFGGAVAAIYGLLVVSHIVFGLFFALTIVCICRGLLIAARGRVAVPAAAREKIAIQAPTVAAGIER